ncbi:hypothetical protein L6164_026472 [Bauhinia variegata]|uniref:Uncharacterized protein n=1 Tax=Bauhinia variegata TaxID=167791 RepID=A0ACB9LQ09_BAUVA|nr:hypothetical protein L6164_026472 [Bauhinia variegata]
MAEMLVEHKKENLHVVILRPTIVTSTYKEPFPGWVEGVRTVDSCVIAYCKRKLSCLPGDIKAAIDVIPTDMVVNAIIVAMVANASKCSNNIYHVGSSIRNPIKYMNILDYFYEYSQKCHGWTRKGSQSRFDDRNMEKVEMAAKQGGVEMDLFYFDPKMIDWEDYFMNVHFPGMVKYLIK